MRAVHLRRAGLGDVAWLTAVGLDPEEVGSQYHWLEAPLQLGVAPARALAAPWRHAAVVEVDGRRAGYVGPNPRSGNLEYFVQPWARGGVGGAIVGTYLRDFRAGDRPRTFFVAAPNERSLATLRRAVGQLGWVEGRQYRIEHRTRGFRGRARCAR